MVAEALASASGQLDLPIDWVGEAVSSDATFPRSIVHLYQQSRRNTPP